MDNTTYTGMEDDEEEHRQRYAKVSSMAMNYDEANLNNAVWYSFLNRSETIYKARECL